VLWQAFTSTSGGAADRRDRQGLQSNSPNDLLREIDRMEFYVLQTRELVKGGATGPLVFITSNNEKVNCPTRSCAAAFFSLHQFPPMPRR